MKKSSRSMQLMNWIRQLLTENQTNRKSQMQGKIAKMTQNCSEVAIEFSRLSLRVIGDVHPWCPGLWHCALPLLPERGGGEGRKAEIAVSTGRACVKCICWHFSALHVFSMFLLINGINRLLIPFSGWLIVSFCYYRLYQSISSMNYLMIHAIN